ncbi:Clan MG, family M24, aminopeptidase P-like metallopeptidase [Trichomonas vaginalis G3]|uniref:Methionine aminopeptidase n=1 Tax=Trichomonas vaginalis (strain ATCC PRA-98 / G3) TaxID=412133 RepID=A2DKI5_TRIV3|nr:methionine aminopeptidase 2 family [Trichomonas vaginalis G3]EAY19162.1 Clan MG, family M24, aminopeptidase P-like metallopeptidase [Trichomonas vaginalis G3]KAI5490460.1 methionine aminopeptidase 2 family [Trichomonas vaginalis G3]|eukprot:XP_001580148.1 Clan MG, familly M24, aminopeptidase P-like metallopeptidase [Trichomonas vaginalis G3]
MSRKAGKKGAKPKIEDDDDDQMAFLLAAAAKNNAKKEEEAKKVLIPDEVFKDLPEPPLKLHPDGNFGERCIQKYSDEMLAKVTVDTSAEERLAELKEALPSFREAGIIHQSVCEWAMRSEIIKPGVNLNDMCARIEEGVRRMVEFNPPVRGLAFPCGCSINNCAAHYSPLPGDTRVLQKDDVMKIDFGVAINGYIIDSAFTACFDPRFDPLIEASKQATETAVKMAGPEARISEIAAQIEEVITSYSIELNGKTIPLKPVYNLTGHQLGKYIIHCGKSIPLTNRSHTTDKMLPGEVYACETFATTGKGIVFDDGITSHFMTVKQPPTPKSGSEQKLLTLLQDNFKTMAFCQRFIERAGDRTYSLTLNELIKNKIVKPYPPLSDVEGSYVSQHEHTYALFEDHKEVFSKPFM